MARTVKRRKRRRKLRPAVKCVIILVLTALIIIFGIKLNIKIDFGKGKTQAATSDKGLELKSLTAPDYVKVDLIHLGDARKGLKLETMNGVVVHYTGNPKTTAQNNRDYFDKATTEVCSHFVIGIDGEIIQCLPLDERSAASNNRNRDTYSIEVCHEDESGKFSDEAYASLVKLTAWLLDNASLDEKAVIRHYDVTGKECPKYFVDNESAWKKFIKDVGAAL